MKKIMLILLLVGCLFAEYKVTQFYGVTSAGYITEKSWKTDAYGGVYGGSSSSVINSIKFKNKKDGKIIIVSAPFLIEEI